MSRHTKRKRLMSEINVVPYIDVMLVLLVIFMITAPLLTEGVKVELPSAQAKPLDRSDNEPLVVAIDSDGQFYIQFGEDQDKPVDAVTLVNRASAVIRHRPNVQVLVRGDETVPYGDVVYVMTLLQKAGAPSVGLINQTAGTRKEPMKPRELIDNLTATSLAVIVHVVLLGILVVSLDWTSPSVPSSSSVEPVKAVVVDESQVAEEIEQIKKREEKKRKEEQSRTKDLERDAQKARKQRREEEKRLSDLQRRLAEEKRKHDDQTRKQREEAAKALAEVKRQRVKELEEIEKLKREESDIEKRRLGEEKALAVLAAQHKALAEEKRKMDEAKRRSEAERTRVEEQTRKAKAAQQAEQKRLTAIAAAATAKAAEEKRKKDEARQAEQARKKAEEERRQAEEAKRKAEQARKQAEADERRKQEETARREQLVLEQARLDAERVRLRDRHLAEYIGQIQATVNRNWIRPTGASKGLKCTVKVSQIPGGEVVRVVITKGSGNVAFDRSVENAVLRSSPLPQPKDPSLFAREIIFEFEPED